tara:strand:- start:32304 stop:32783 length:480 start_codon:yes stop_codon:yes gene_type:complete
MKIKNFENYTVHIDGRIIGSRGKVLKVDTNSSGYHRVTLSKGGKTKRRFVHHIVAEHFCVNPYQRHYINHIDGNRTNNHARNLEWCTASQNVKDGFDRGREVPWALTEYMKTQLIFMYEAGYNYNDMSRRWGVSPSTASRCIKKWRERATTIPKGSTLK